eukprot:a509279_354.p2 GENE.a509279_354~~a509279_354.p2  ORF type:complete len:255 (-),score=109.54 a509279_354:94-828(-)
MANTEIVLDPHIRNWVLIPIVLLMLLFAVLRHFITKYLAPGPVKQTRLQIRNNQALNRARILQKNAHWLPLHAFLRRKGYFNDAETGVFNETQPEVNPMDAMSNPAMASMMTGNFGMMIPQMLTMGLVNFFFTGFVMLRLPFPVTEQFKAMLQRGVELSHLDVSYISSLSLYFIALFGLRGVITLLLSGNEGDDAQLMQKQMSGGPAAPAIAAAFKDEKERLEIAHHEPHVDGAMARVLARARS